MRRVRQWVWVLVLGSVPGLLLAAGAALIRRGEPATVWLAAEAAPEERAAAGDLARVLGIMAGTGPARVEEAPRWRRPEGIHVGRTPAALGSFAELRYGPGAGIGGARDRDTALIAVGGGRVVLAGYDAGGTVLAVYRFLQTEGGVHWLFPGDAGEVIPRRTEWRVSGQRRREVPGFLSREFYFGRTTPEEALWARRNLLRPRAEFSHRASAYAPETAYAAHPEWFAQFPDGPRDPRQGRRGDWQPNYGHPAVSEQIAEAALRAFGADPQRLFFAVAPNDSVRFGDLPGDAQVGWFRRHPDLTAPVLAAIDNAARRVAERHPDRYLGTLAYHWYEGAPAWPLSPNLAVYLALDRFQGRHPGRAREDAELVRAWVGSGAGFVGIYDYVHGQGMAGPRVWPRRMAAAWADAHAAGARGLFAELAPHWGWQGLQPWLAAQVAWDPALGRRGIDDALGEAWRAWAGRGAPYLQAVFRLAEQLATAAPGEPRWLPDYREADQLALFPESFWRTALAGLEAAQAAEPAAAERLERVLGEPFRLGAELAAFDVAREELRRALEDGQEGLRLAVRLERYAEARAAVEERAARLASDPLHFRAGSLGYLLAEDPALAAEARLVGRGGELLDWLDGGMEKGGGVWRRVDGARFRPLTAVEGGVGEVPAGWWWEVVPAEGMRFGVEPAAARSGEGGFRVEGVEAGLLASWVPAEAGATYRLTVPVRGRRPPGAVAMAVLAWYGADGRPVAGAPVRRDRPARGERERWRAMELVDTAPPGAVMAMVGVSLRHWSPGQGLDIDDVTWERLGPVVEAEPAAEPASAPESAPMPAIVPIPEPAPAPVGDQRFELTGPGPSGDGEREP